MKAFLNAMITDGRAEGLSASTSSILVDDSGRIEAVGTGDLAVPEGYEVLDCRGHTVYPGLIDMHTHLNEASLGLFVDHGVTTVRDVGNDLQTVLGLRATTSDGTARGPASTARGRCSTETLLSSPPPRSAWRTRPGSRRR